MNTADQHIKDEMSSKIKYFYMRIGECNENIKRIDDKYIRVREIINKKENKSSKQTSLSTGLSEL